jgi:hypothetical protein
MNWGEGSSNIDPTSYTPHDKSPEVDTSIELLWFKCNIQIHLATVEHLKDVVSEADAQRIAAIQMIKGILPQIQEAQEAMVEVQDALLEFEKRLRMDN